MSLDGIKKWSAKVRPLALYPEAGQKTAPALQYAALGLAGETGELVEAFDEILKETPDRQRIVKELGDVLWYVDAVAHEVGSSAAGVWTLLTPRRVKEAHITNPVYLIELVKAAGKVAEAAKKFARDGKLEPESVVHTLSQAVLMACMIAVQIGVDFDDILAVNAEKLLSRAARGKLGGSGDDR